MWVCLTYPYCERETEQQPLKLFGDKATEFLILCYLGIGRTEVHPVEEYERKSVGTERTFPDLWGAEKLRERMKMTAEDLEKDVGDLNLAFRTLTLKIKLYTYGVYSRQRALHRPIHTAHDIYQYSLPLLASLEAEFQDKGGLRIRLMGLRGTNLVDRTKKSQGFWGKWGEQVEKMAGTKRKKLDEDGWEIWPEEELERMNPASNSSEPKETLSEGGQEDEEAKDITLEILSQGISSTENLHDSEHKKGKEIASSTEEEQQAQDPWQCPICSHPVAADHGLLNEHIDWCLSRDAIREVVKENSSKGEAVITRPSAKRPKTGERKKSAAAVGSGNGGHFPLFKHLSR